MALTTARVAREFLELGAVPRELPAGQWPSVALAFGDSFLALLRDHGGRVTLSLPTAWVGSCAAEAELPALRQAFVRTLASFRASHPECVTLADAIVALVPALELTTRQEAVVSFPGTPVPSEAWLTSGTASVGVFQQGAAAYAVVWVAGKLRRLALPKRSALHALPGWLSDAVAAQLEHGAGAPVTPLPPGPEATLADVLRAMRAGTALEIGGGRYSTTYFVAEGQLQRTTFDEGETWTERIGEGELAQAFISAKQAFQRELARKRDA